MSENRDIIRRREKYLAPSFSLSYQEPLHIVRGEGQYLYDVNGKKYLDAVNNISHVGHCHPKVVAAITKQASTLNTHTRYLHEGIINYIDEDYLISDLELESHGRETIKNMLINLFQKNDANYQLIRCRQLLTAIFNYAEDENYISHNQNPVARKFQWEGDKHIKRDPKQKSFAHTLKGKSW